MQSIEEISYVDAIRYASTKIECCLFRMGWGIWFIAKFGKIFCGMCFKIASTFYAMQNQSRNVR